VRQAGVFGRISPRAIQVGVLPARIATDDDWRHFGVHMPAVVLNRRGKLLRGQARILSDDI